MKYLYLILSIITIVYLVLSAKRDLKERLIYSFPCLILVNAWGIVAFKNSGLSTLFVSFYLLCHVAVVMLMKRFRLWGDGDGDMFLLLGNICLACIPIMSGISIVILECLLLVVVMAVAIFIGWIEYRVKKKTFCIKGDVAVVPGFAVVMSGVIMFGVCGRFWF